jgi:toxin ParE1/3/4
MIIRWTVAAQRDLNEIDDFVAQDSPHVAARVIEEIRNAVGALATFPHMGREGLVPGTRELVMAGLPYLIAYRVRQEAIEVLAVLHAARDRVQMLVRDRAPK